ncbi:hypothetical protein Tco_1352687 [Tanacetum coccineum]
MRTRNSNFPNNSPVTIPRRRNRRRAPNVVEPELRTIVEVAPMADNRTMEELLQAPTEGYGEAIVIPQTSGRGHVRVCAGTFYRHSTIPRSIISELQHRSRVMTHLEATHDGQRTTRKSQWPMTSSISTTPLSDSRPSLISFETSNSIIEEFTDELALLDPFPPGNEDVDFEADLREIELLLNRDPSTDFSPKITFDPNPERFTNKPALVCLPPPGDDESFLKKDVQEVNFRIYSNSLFEFDDNYNSSNINPLFKEILEDVESEDSNVSNEPVYLTHLFLMRMSVSTQEAILIRSMLF